jgi:8-oxo-dGTP diphosphatase
LRVQLVEQFYTYSDPKRDPRHHTVSTVFIATAEGVPDGADDAKSARVFGSGHLPNPLVFDHARILQDYLAFKATGHRPKPASA